MASSKKASKRTRKPKQQKQSSFFSSSSSCSQLIQDITASLHSSQELKLPELKRLYYLLVYLSLDPVVRDTSGGAVSSFLEINIGLNGIMVPFTDICNLMDIAFKTLFEMFKAFLTALNCGSASFPVQDTLYLDTCATAQRLNLLLRCCLFMLKFLILDQNRLVENGRVLHAILVKLCSFSLNRGNEENTIHFEKVSQGYNYDDTHFSLFTEKFVASLQFVEPIDHCHHFFCGMLEVFLDELLVDGRLCQYFKLIDSCFTSNRLFMSHPSHSDIGTVIEVICAHFCISFSDEPTCKRINDRLFGFQGGKFEVPEVGSLSALTLLLNPLMLTAPKYLHAHLISLIADSISSNTGLQDDIPDVTLIDSYLSALERSVILYNKHMSTSEMNLRPKSDANSVCKSGPSFESYLRPATRKQLDLLNSKLDNLLQLQLEHGRARSNSNLVAIAYSKEMKNINASFNEEIISILSSIILIPFPDEVVDGAFRISEDTSSENIYLLASIMKLISCSLLQVTKCLMYSGDSGCSRTLKDLNSRKHYDFLMKIISSFQTFRISLPNQQFLLTTLETFPEKHKESKLMLIHFSGLLSLCFRSGIEFLVKGCISIMITVMDLFVFEEGNLDALRLLYSSGSHEENDQEGKAGRRSSTATASKFQKMHALYLSIPPLAIGCTGTENKETEISRESLVIEEEMEEACSGKFFLKCRMRNHEKPHDFDDLADFIECKNGKDYSGWLKDRQRYRKRKLEKMAVVKWKRKKKIWKFMKGN